MNRVDFEQKLDVHGGDLDRWPAEDAAVRQATLKPLDAALVGRILAATPPRRAGWRLGWRPLLPAGALALLLVAGLGFRAGYADRLSDSHELDIAALVVGDLDGLRTLP